MPLNNARHFIYDAELAAFYGIILDEQYFNTVNKDNLIMNLI